MQLSITKNYGKMKLIKTHKGMKIYDHQGQSKFRYCVKGLKTYIAGAYKAFESIRDAEKAINEFKSA